MYDLTKLDEKFPFEEFRPGQKECIEAILNAFDKGKKFVILEAPTGSGKSAIGLTIANYFNETYYLTIQKILQDQLAKEFENDKIKCLKGRNAYRCNFWETYMTKYEDDPAKMRQMEIDAKDPEIHKTMANPHLPASEGVCMVKERRSRSDLCFPKGNGDLKASLCPYWKAVGHAMTSQTCIMNFHSFLFQTAVTDRFKPRGLLILDECLHPHTHIRTNIGRVAIGKLVNQNIQCEVLSYNQNTQKLEYKPILRRLKRDKQQTYRVLAGNRVLYPTLDHKIYTPSGKKPLRDLKVGDKVLVTEPGFTKAQKQVVLGSLLGDACGTLVPSQRKSKRYIKKKTRARVRFQHGPKQFEYLDWKYSILKDHVGTPPKIYETPDAFGDLIKKFSTNCNLYRIIKDVFVKKKKTPNNEWLNQLDDLAVAVWYMDDGSMNGGCSYFHTEDYTQKQCKLISSWLNKKYDFSSKILSYKKKRKKYHYIALSRKDSQRLSQKIAKYVIPVMRYKLTGENLEEYNPNIETQFTPQISQQEIKLIEPYKTTITYDLEVADNHNYVAGTTIVSNCHNAEPQLMDFISLTLTDRTFRKEGVKIPEFDTAEEYAKYFEDIQLTDKIEDIVRLANYTRDFKKADDWKKVLLQYNIFLKNFESGDWIPHWEDRGYYHRVTLKPIFVNKHAQSYLFNHGEKVLMMSATVLQPKIIYESLGIDPSDAYAYRMKNRFPKKNRPIYFKPAGSMNYKNKQETMPKLLGSIESIAKEYSDKKGIIHTHNFEIAKFVIQKGSKTLKRRLFFQENYFTKDEMLKKHADSKNGIIIAPAMHEGLDLKGPLSRFQIICKVPYPAFKDNEQLKIRMQLSQDYYNWLTALKLIQSYGRSIRSVDDWADTYILDEEFRRFKRSCFKLLPKWFLEVIE